MHQENSKVRTALFAIICIAGLTSCGDKKTYQAQLNEANAKLAQLQVEENAATKELAEAKNNVTERMNLLLRARHPDSPNIGSSTKGSVDELDEITEYFNRESDRLTKEVETLKVEVDDLKKDLATYKATYSAAAK